MPLIEWTEAFSVGDETIDNQHKEWIAIYNKAHERMMGPDGNDFRKTGIEALEAMEEYGRYHFKYEEEYQERIGFHDRDRHRNIHEAFMKRLDQFRLDIHRGKHVLNSEIIKTIENWLKDHILNEDQKFRRPVS